MNELIILKHILPTIKIKYNILKWPYETDYGVTWTIKTFI